MEYFKSNSVQPECTDLQRCLAQVLLAVEEGRQLPSARELAERYNASLGSVSAAVNQLEEMGAVTISRRGRLGSFLEKKSLGKLWKIVESSPLVVALTLPSFPKSEGLATAIFSLLDQARIETYLIFIRGSYNRLQALRNGRCHAAVMSALAAEEMCDQQEEIVLRLPPQSFVTDHRVFYRRKDRAETAPLRVGVDLDSFDIKYLTELEFAGCEVEFSPMTLLQIDRYFEQSSVDAAISNLDHIERLKSAEITSRPLSSRVQDQIGDRDTSAAIIIKAGAGPVKGILEQVLVPQQLLQIQQQVVDGDMVPRY